MPKPNNPSSSLTTAIALAGFFLFYIPSFAFASTIISGAISEDTTWTQAQSPYVVQGVTIPHGITLTIDPGVVIKFKSNFSQFFIDGTLIVNGTPGEKVYFTSIKDDSVGGDTNGDESATSPDPQDWMDIQFNVGSTGTIKNTIIRYGGSRACTGWGCGGSQSGLFNNGGVITISDSQLSYNNVMGISQNSGSLHVTHSEIDHHTNGFFLGFGTTATISNSNFHDNRYGITTSSGGSLILTNNTFQNNSLGAASVNALIDFTHSGNTASGTGRKTFVISGNITSNTQWNNDLPYLVQGVTVDAEKTLTIDPGVIIKFENLNSSLVIDGILNIQGTKTDPVFLTSLKDDSVGGDTNGDGDASVPIHGDWMHLQFNAGSTGVIHYAKVRYGGGFHQVAQAGSFSGININGGSVNISHSEIDHNGSYFNFLGITKYSGDLTISDSSIHDNLTYGISNSSLGSPIQAINNWWGDATGPRHSLLNVQGNGNRVSDNINFIPWLGYDPTKDQPQGNSSVVFLPGFEGSRLYRGDPGCIIINCENQLWEPNRNDDVRKLYLSPTTGKSVNPDIYTRDVIDEAFGVNIYKNFLSFMDGLVATDVINHFETLPYDWRDDQKDVVTGIIPLESGAYHIPTRIEEIANSSPTGKVTLITHSNGGLVAKELVEDLKSRGKENLIDRIIMVAAPQLGTPKAIFEMLHGAEPFLLNFPDKEVTRELAENMKSAYTLLPSRTYFDRLSNPLIRPLVEFSTTTPVTESFRNIYGNSISDYDTLRRFLRGENGTRMEPQASAVNEPNVLKENFLTNAETRHIELDTWVPPLGIDVIEIIGWGLDTPRGVMYGSVKKKVCNANLSVCSKIDVIDPQPLKTSEGDGTVVYPSAEALGGERYWVNIFDYNEVAFTINRAHKNILEIESLQDLIATLLKNEATSTLPLFISSTKPSEIRDDKRLAIGVHSPVALHLYDSLGHHTGIIPNPNPSSDLNLYEEQIPNSYYWQVGEGQYAGVDDATTTIIELQGTDFGTFTIDIENIVGGVTATTTVYKDIPVTASTTATFVVGNGTTTPLLLDIDGDGTTDASIIAGGLTTEDFVGILKGVVKTLHLSTEKEKKLIKKIEKLERELKKEHKNERMEKRKTGHAFKEIIKIIRKYEKKGILTHDEAGELITIIGQIEAEMIE